MCILTPIIKFINAVQETDSPTKLTKARIHFNPQRVFISKQSANGYAIVYRDFATGRKLSSPILATQRRGHNANCGRMDGHIIELIPNLTETVGLWLARSEKYLQACANGQDVDLQKVADVVRSVAKRCLVLETLKPQNINMQLKIDGVLS